jgi:uncharacterized protein (TIGR00251 family)
VPSAGTDATTLRVRVQPRASRQAILGWREDVLRVAVTAPPVEGEANEAVHVVRGERGRDKLMRVDGVTGRELHARLAAQDRAP